MSLSGYLGEKPVVDSALQHYRLRRVGKYLVLHVAVFCRSALLFDKVFDILLYRRYRNGYAFDLVCIVAVLILYVTDGHFVGMTVIGTEYISCGLAVHGIFGHAALGLVHKDVLDIDDVDTVIVDDKADIVALFGAERIDCRGKLFPVLVFGLDGFVRDLIRLAVRLREYFGRFLTFGGSLFERRLGCRSGGRAYSRGT